MREGTSLRKRRCSTSTEARATHLLRALQQNVCAVDVVLRELERVSEGVVHVRLGREVEDRVDLFLPEDVRDKVRRADVPLHELKPSKPTKSGVENQGSTKIETRKWSSGGRQPTQDPQHQYQKRMLLLKPRGHLIPNW